MDLTKMPVWLRAAVSLAILGGLYAGLYAVQAMQGRAALGKPCTMGADCGYGSLCTTDRYCTIECTSDRDCGGDLICADGRAGDDAQELRDGFFRKHMRVCAKRAGVRSQPLAGAPHPGLPGATTPSTTRAAAHPAGVSPSDPYQADIARNGGMVRPFDAKAHPDVLVTEVNGAFRLQTSAFDVTFPARPELAQVAADGSGPVAPGLDMMFATAEGSDSDHVAVLWIPIPRDARFNDDRGLEAAIGLMREAGERIVLDQPMKIGGHDGRVIESTRRELGAKVRIETRVVRLANARVVVGLTASHRLDDIAATRTSWLFLDSFHVR